MKILNFIKEIGLYIWQLPQNLLGLLLIAIYKPEKDTLVLDNNNIVYFSRTMPGGISLGKYSIINSYYAGLKTGKKTRLEDSVLKELDVVKHEGLGHSKQSRILGPFYLPVIGLPSIIWAWMYGTIIPYTHNGYYVFYTEKWADKLAGIMRK